MRKTLSSYGLADLVRIPPAVANGIAAEEQGDLEAAKRELDRAYGQDRTIPGERAVDLSRVVRCGAFCIRGSVRRCSEEVQ